MAQPDTALRALAAGVHETSLHFQWPKPHPGAIRGDEKDMIKARIIAAFLKRRGWVLKRKDNAP